MAASDKLPNLSLYAWVAKFRRLNYQSKIMVMAFIGTHMPLLSLACWFAFQSTHDWHVLVRTLSVALVATLAGTAITLLVLHHLLRPVVATARALRLFREHRQRLDLPTQFTDEVGTLMADAHRTLEQLDKTMDALEFVDEVTGLPNRKRFANRVQERMALGQPFAVAIVRDANLTRIAEAVDAQGSEAAARILALRLAKRGHPEDQLSRIGPSKFGFILQLQDASDTWPLAAARLRESLASSGGEMAISGMTFRPQLQAGIAAFPEDGQSAQMLIDAAVNAASLAAHSEVLLHTVEQRRAVVEQLKLEQDLRRALERNEFVLHYQPVFDLQVGRAIGAEALLRWQHPERGLVPPGAFIGTAEASGLIEPLGLWVIRQACQQLGEWNRTGLAGLRMAVNVSARQFLDPALRQHLRDAIESARISPDQLEIELTETVAMVDHAHTRRMFSALRSDGLSIAIDDFGTGYASMSYLRKLPVDKLKIDREFVTDVHRTRQSQAICGALIELAQGLDLRILAEGAERESEVRYLAQQGCDLFQGYYFSRPVSAEQFAQSLTVPEGILRRVHEPITHQAMLAPR